MTTAVQIRTLAAVAGDIEALRAAKEAERKAKYPASAPIETEEQARDFYAKKKALKPQKTPEQIKAAAERLHDENKARSLANWKAIFERCHQMSVEEVAAACGLFVRRSGANNYKLFINGESKFPDFEASGGGKTVGKDKPAYWDRDGKRMSDSVDFVSRVLGYKT